jgi:phosphoenolpyruvate synthase/pyruvate phosphate dikinase
MNVEWLKQIRGTDVDTVGGKAASLGELASLGMPIPNGFVVCNPMTPSRALLEAQGTLGSGDRYQGGEFAVRSSGIAEDGRTASMAGQHDTFLNVAGSDIPETVKRCFASVHNQRAIAYREINEIIETRLAVLVQVMVEPSFSGVLFTVDPVEGDATIMAVDYVRGTGEKLVSGETIPSSFDMPRHGTPQGTPLPMIGKLHSYALEIESHFGCPQDIEWCIDLGGALWILQARPITTL